MPTFQWDETAVSPFGVPLVNIFYPDGDSDVADLRKVSSKACIYNGYLRKEPSSYVVLSKGCPFTYTFEIQFYSSHLPKGFSYNVVDGVVSKTVSPFQRGNVSDRHLMPEGFVERTNKATERLAFPPNGFDLNVKFFYDQLFMNQFGGDIEATLDSIFNLVQGFYLLPSLTTKINLKRRPDEELQTNFTDGASVATL